jgi:excisionase family DNA binding protein
MRDAEQAAAFAITQAKNRGQAEIGPDELLLGSLQAISQFGIAQLGPWTFDLEDLGVDWREYPDKASAKVAYSHAVVRLMDLAYKIARSEGPELRSSSIRADHLLAAFAGEETGLMGELKQQFGITSSTWRAAIAQLAVAPHIPAPATPQENQAPRDFLTPEEAAEALGIHVQTLRGYVRSGKLPALRLAGERAIRIRRADLEAVLEPLVPTSLTP